jgi:hypothetical protein
LLGLLELRTQNEHAGMLQKHVGSVG